MPGYPYKSKLRQTLAKRQAGVDFVRWQDENFDMAEALAATTGDLLEVGGPSFDGYYFLEDIALPRPLIISNLNDKPFADAAINARANKYISRHIDAANLPYEDATLGAVFCHYLSYATDETPHDRSAHDSAKWRHAYSEMGEIILGLRRPETAVVALRVKLLREAWRALELGGIVVMDGQLAELEIMNQIGFTPLAILLDGLDMEEIVLQKPAGNEPA